MAKLQRERSAFKQVPAWGGSSRGLPYETFCGFYLPATPCLGSSRSTEKSKVAKSPRTLGKAAGQKELTHSGKSKLPSWHVLFVSGTREGGQILSGENWWSNKIADPWLQMALRLTSWEYSVSLYIPTFAKIKPNSFSLAKTNAWRKAPWSVSPRVPPGLECCRTCTQNRKGLMVSKSEECEVHMWLWYTEWMLYTYANRVGLCSHPVPAN